MTPTSFVGRSDVVDRVVAVLEARRSGAGGGVVLVGPAGIGKTAIARRLIDRLVDVRDPVWIAGSIAAVDVPLGAFAAYLPPAGTEAGLPSLLHVRDAVMRSPTGRSRLLVVDDAQSLDETSAALVHQLVLHGVDVVMTQRSGSPAPESVTRLWREQLVERVDVRALDPEEVEQLSASLLDGPVERASAREVWRRSAGNPLFARELVLASREAGEWSSSDAGWCWDVGGGQAPRLADLLQHRLDRLTDEQRSALVHLAFGEPMGLGEFAPICEEAVLEELEALELVTVELDRRRLVIRFTHPLHAEVVRRGVTPLRARAVRSTLVDAIRATGGRRRDDAMRLATLALDAGVDVDADLLVDAARRALASGESAAALRLATAAFEQRPDFATGHALADAWYEDGRFERIAEHWPAWEPHARSEHERAFVAMHQAISWFYRAGDATTAFDVLAEAERATAPGPARDEIRALIATLSMMCGRVDDAIDIAEPLLATASDGRVLVQAALATTQSMRAAARTGDALAINGVAMTTLAELGPVESLVSTTVFRTGEASILLVAGRFPDALASADVALSAALQTGDDSAEGLSQLSRSEAFAMQGRFVDAAAAAEAASAAFARANHRGFRRWAVSQRAFIAALAGDVSAAAAATDELAQLGPHPAELFEYVAVMTDVITHWPVEPHRTRVDALDAARRLAARGDRHGAVRAAYELIRCGDVEAVDAVVEWASGSDSELHRTMADHARALGGGDVQQLGDVAERLAAMEATVYACSAGAQAAALARNDGDERTARRWDLAADRWRGRWTLPAMKTPGEAHPAPDQRGELLAPLTRREREVVLLAAQGLASRTIGDRLFLSPRTVDNHLARAYVKLGIGSRAELAHALASA